MKQPTVDYATLLGRCFGLHTSYNQNVLTRDQFLASAKEIKEDYERQAAAMRVYWSAEFDSATSGDGK